MRLTSNIMFLPCLQRRLCPRLTLVCRMGKCWTMSLRCPLSPSEPSLRSSPGEPEASGWQSHTCSISGEGAERKNKKGNNEYSLSLFDNFCPVKRNSEYFTEKWSEQKVLIIKVVGLYSTYQKYERIGVPSAYQLGENWTWVFSTKKLQKSKHFFSKN